MWKTRFTLPRRVRLTIVITATLLMVLVLNRYFKIVDTSGEMGTRVRVSDLIEIAAMVAKAHRTANDITETRERLHEILLKIQGLVNSEIEKVVEKMQNQTGILDVCPEVYNGRTTSDRSLGGRDGFPLFLDEEGWEFDKCLNAHPLEDVVTLLLNGVHYSNQNVEDLINQIRKYYPKLKLLVTTKYALNKKDPNIHVVRGEFNNSAIMWKKLVSQVNTKYAVVLKDVFRFTNYTRIERLVDVAFRHDVPIVGGSSVGFNGHWWNNCYQIYMKLYELRYIHGYHISKDSCMYCEYMAGPFLGRTDFLKDLLRDLKEDDDFLFHRMFFKIKKEGVVGMVCPDTMFHVDHIVIEKTYDKQFWLPLALSYGITKISGFSGIVEFECKELSIKCPLSRKGMAEAPCCLKTMSQCLEKAAQLANERNVAIEIVCGSLLGTLKLNWVMPWDIDTDAHYYKGNQSDTDKWNPYLRPSGCVLLPTFDNGNERQMKSNNWDTDFTPKPMLSSLNYMKRTGYNTTRVLFGKTWIQAPPSPSLNIRNVYRSEVYRHVPHPKQGGSYTFPQQSFPKCPEPGHHACLDQFIPDGNLQFSMYMVNP